jgi:hypothetical protein
LVANKNKPAISAPALINLKQGRSYKAVLNNWNQKKPGNKGGNKSKGTKPKQQTLWCV